MTCGCPLTLALFPIITGLIGSDQRIPLIVSGKRIKLRSFGLLDERFCKGNLRSKDFLDSRANQ